MRNTLAATVLVLLALAAAVAFGGGDAGPRDVEIATARGVKLHAVLHTPAKANGAAVVIAPGKGFPPSSPLLATCARSLADAGFSVVLFDYAYYAVKDGKNSPDLSVETADMEAAIDYAKKLSGVTKVILAGKSLGSVIALDWANAHPDALAGLALLTFVVNDPAKPGEALEQASALVDCPYPALVVNGADDTMTVPHVMYEVAAKCRTAPQIVYVPGNHGLAPASKDAAETAENCDLAAHALALWAKRRIAAK